MASPSRPSVRTRAAVILTAAATLAGGAALLGPGTSSASSHREAPYISSDPAVDNTDTYAFVNPDNANMATLIANVSPFQDPAGGPNYFPFATDARYNINVDNNGDAVPDLTFRWTFKDIDKRGAAQHGNKGGASFLYADGPVTSLDDANLLFRQSYSVEVIANPTSSTPTATTLIADAPVAAGQRRHRHHPGLQEAHRRRPLPPARSGPARTPAPRRSPASARTRSSSTCGSSTCSTAVRPTRSSSRASTSSRTRTSTPWRSRCPRACSRPPAA